MAKPDGKQAHRRQAARRQPITRHPLFPAVVALWFAALLALGSLALSTTLIENLVLAARIDSIVPATAPSLGVIARLMLALLLGLVGGATGWFLAKQVTAAKTATAPQVFNVTEADLGAPPQWPGMAQVHAGPEPDVLPELPALSKAAATQPVPMLDPASLEEDAETPPRAATVVGEQDVVPTLRQLALRDASPVTPARTAAQRIADADLAELSHVELVERLAIALQRREELLDISPGEAADRTAPVVRLPGFADRSRAHLPLQTSQTRAAPQETEKALRAALVQLERMSGAA